jgi:acyl dehydratase
MPLHEGEIWGEITEASLERLLQRKGVSREERGTMFRLTLNEEEQSRFDAWRPEHANFAITKETNGRIARGIADLNPLYVDESYARRSIWGAMLAPPATLCWTETVNGATEGFPGCHTIWRGVEYEWERPMFAGEPIASRTYLTDAELVESGFAGGKAAVQRYETEAYNLEGSFIGAYRTSWHRFSRKKARSAGKYAGIERHQWTDEELEGVWEEYRTHNLANRRGDEPLYIEDVTVGEELPHLIKGPITLTSKIAFEMAFGAGGWFVGHELAMQLWEHAPRLPIRNEENVPEPPVAIHWTNERCQTYLGMPGAYEAGFERLNWFTQLLMSWYGDHGMLRRLGLAFRAFHWQGDAVRLYATVTGTRVEEDRHLVDLELRSESHPRGELTSEGTATVELPSRAAGNQVWPAAGEGA